MKAQKRLGIVGGLGTETSCDFCLVVNNIIRQKKRCQPDIVMENVAVPLDIEKSMINGTVEKRMEKLLLRAVSRLNNSGADFIVIPCNTVHVFIDSLRKNSRKPILSIIEETANECVKREAKKVGLLASTTTVKQKLHETELGKRGIDILLPRNQKKVSEVILNILASKAGEKEIQTLLAIIGGLKQDGADVVILGCTDLQSIMNGKESALPLIDTTAVLINSAVKELCKPCGLKAWRNKK